MGNKTSKTNLKVIRPQEKQEIKTTNQEDIIIKCELGEMVKCFFKDYVIVWHDPNVKSPENEKYRAQLEKFCEVKAFTEWEKAVDYVLTANASYQVITSGTNGELLVKEIHANPNVSSIYIFCGNRDYHSIWARHYSNVRCV